MTDIIKLPPEAQESFVKMQTFQQQLQTIGMQRETLHFQKAEAERALEEIAKTGDNDEIFKAVGPILIKSTKANLEKELKEKMETTEVRLKKLDKEEANIKQKAEENQKKLQELLKPAEESKQTAG